MKIRSSELSKSGVDKLVEFYAENGVEITGYNLRDVVFEAEKQLGNTGSINFEERFTRGPWFDVKVCYFEDQDFVWVDAEEDND